MHSGFEISGIQQQPPENSCQPPLLSMNPTHILDQTQQLLLDHHHHHHHFMSHHYAAAPSPAYFKLGLNDFKDATAGGGSQHFELPQARQSSLGMLHAPFWEPLPAEVSNENSEELKQKETLRHCLDAKSRVQFSELEAIYKRLGNAETTQTAPTLSLPVTHPHLPAVEPRETTDTKSTPKKKKKQKKKKINMNTNTNTSSHEQSVLVADPMAEFFENLVNQVMHHQESLQKKFTEVMDRLNEERREREEAWRSEELAHFEREAAARAHDKALANTREAMIVSYLEKITGHRVNLPPLTTSPPNTSDDSN